MKKGIVVVTTILLISIMIAGGSMAWFTSSPEKSINDSKMGTVKIDVIKNGDKSIRIQNIGSSEIYVRVRLIPQWSDPSLSVSNVKINISSKDWTSKQSDGYYYYKHPLKENKKTKKLSNNLEIDNLKKEYENADFNLKVVAEGVQVANKGWKKVWGINSLPFSTN